MNGYGRRISIAIALAAAAGGCAVSAAPPAGPGPHSAAAAAAPPPVPGARDLVVLVHGMGRTSLSMWRMERSLERAGYAVLNWGYSSTCCSIAELGRRLRDDITDHLGGRAARVHFVGHSLGTVVIRAALNDDAPEHVGRIVLLAPPSRGARAADLAAPLLGWLMPPLEELSTTDSSTASTLPWPPLSEIAVIAGRFDAKVSPEEARLDGAALIVLPATHTFLMMRADAIRATIGFLRHGRVEEPIRE